tara:strand:- start:340 stop:717 length:378 start_codon:yes stop_codon:yes gene_type:complete
MRNLKNNYKRSRFRSNNDRNFKRNGSHQRLNQDFTNGSDFKRRNPGRNNQNASKLIEKYINLAREALSNGDKILSENYFQHADHFSRISSQQLKKEDTSVNSNSESNNVLEKDNTEEDKDNTQLK